LRKWITARAALAIVAVCGGCAEELPETPPRQLPGSPFHYPEEMWDAGVEGETVLRLYVAPGGGVDTIRVERTSGYAAFDTAAVAGARELQFDPARRGPDAIGAWVLLPVQFDLPTEAAEGGAP
jgi:protein TonB